eukprot:CAMPEP_0183503260 /NCGR_PEP_ID=MMETSP0371-20130417/4979_1 /TAXON_ID=268820 /ORGANISM="Peridinium aciculiferum, Strain PAER-2" /LENGTH=47 /DNA_ID= /DNA_START= /DNA_END= /DNA_ORIENTATION=
MNMTSTLWSTCDWTLVHAFPMASNANMSRSEWFLELGGLSLSQNGLS